MSKYPIFTEEMKKDYLKTLESPDVDEEKSYLICWDAEEKKIVVVFGDDPGTYQEFEESIDKNEAPF